MSQSESAKPKSDMHTRRIGGFWVHEGRSGERYLSGDIDLFKITGRKERVKVTLLKNMRKSMAKFPDYELFLNSTETAKDVLEPQPRPMPISDIGPE